MQPLDNASYDSISAFLAAINGECRNPQNKSVRDDYAHFQQRRSWYGADCADGDAVQSKVRNGWSDGRNRINALRGRVPEPETPPVDRRRRMVRRDTGDVLDIHAVYAGRLDAAWSIAKRQNMQGPQRVEICANMLCSGAEDSEVLFWRGAAASVLIDLLEFAGYMARLVVCFGGTNTNGEKVSCRITVKDHDKPFDVTSTSATILPGFFRALGHAWIAAHSKGNLSSPSISVQKGNVEEGEIFLSHEVRDETTALAWIDGIIKKINNHEDVAA